MGGTSTFGERVVAVATSAALLAPVLGPGAPARAEDCDLVPSMSEDPTVPEDPGDTGTRPFASDGPACAALRTPGETVGDPSELVPPVPPTVSVGDAMAVEDDTEDGPALARFVVQVVPPAGEPLTVHYTTADGTAAAPDDYVPVDDGALAIPAGTPVSVISIEAANDAEAEETETFFVDLTAVEGGDAQLADDARGVASIVDDDSAREAIHVAEVRIDDVAVDEADAPTVARFPVTLEDPAPAAVTVGYRTVPATASEGTDYTGAVGTLTIPAGDSTAEITVPILADTTGEALESFALVVTPSAASEGRAMITDPVAEGTIADDDGGLRLAVADAEPVVEGTAPAAPDAAVFPVSLPGASVPVLVPYSIDTSAGTATAGADYAPQAGVLVFGPGRDRQEIRVPVIPDTTDEPGADETFTLDLQDPVASDTGPVPPVTVIKPTGQATIVDDDAPDVRAFVGAAQASEPFEILDDIPMDAPADTGILRFPLVVIGRHAALDLEYSTVQDGAVPAEPDTDYEPEAGRTVTIPASPQPPIPGLPAVQVLTNDSPLTVTVTDDALGAPDDAPAETLTLAVAPATPDPTVTVNDEAALGTILDDDAPDPDTVTVAAESPTVTEGSPARFVVRSSDAEPSDRLTVQVETVDVGLPVPGLPVPALPGVAAPVRDYAPLGPTSLVLDAGNGFRATVAVPTVDDADPEFPEALVVRVSTSDPAVDLGQPLTGVLIEASDPPSVPTTLPSVPTTLPPPPYALSPTSTSTTTTAPSPPPEETGELTDPPSEAGPPPARRTGTSARATSAARGAVTSSEAGYWIVSADGALETFGDADPSVQGVPGTPTRLVGITRDSAEGGAWLLDEGGGVHARGGAPYLGSLPGRRAQGAGVGEAAAVDIDATPDGQGFVVLDEVGGVHAFGDALYAGSLPARRAAGARLGPARATAVAVTPSGRGYLVLDEVGGVHAFGDARFAGSVPDLIARGVVREGPRFVGIAVSGGGEGYWVVDEEGGVFAFGTAGFSGSIPGLRNQRVPVGSAPATGIDARRDGSGYWIFDAAGGVFTFGRAGFFGSPPERASVLHP